MKVNKLGLKSVSKALEAESEPVWWYWLVSNQQTPAWMEQLSWGSQQGITNKYKEEKIKI